MSKQAQNWEERTDYQHQRKRLLRKLNVSCSGSCWLHESAHHDALSPCLLYQSLTDFPSIAVSFWRSSKQ
eukprot:768061-Amphidinium_carterae.2